MVKRVSPERLVVLSDKPFTFLRYCEVIEGLKAEQLMVRLKNEHLSTLIKENKDLKLKLGVPLHADTLHDE